MPVNTILKLFAPNTAKFQDIFDETAIAAYQTSKELPGLYKSAVKAVRKAHAIKIRDFEVFIAT